MLTTKPYSYSKENFPKLLQVVDAIKKIGDRHGATPGQVTLAWIMAQGKGVIAIPGTTKQKVSLTLHITLIPCPDKDTFISTLKKTSDP